MAEDENVEGARQPVCGIRCALWWPHFVQEHDMTSWFESIPPRRLGIGLLLGVGTLLSLPSCQSEENAPISARQLGLEEQSYYYGLDDVRVSLSFQSDRVGLVTVEKVGRVQVNAVAAAFGLKLQAELSGGFFILTGQGLTKRADVVKLAREIRAKYPRVVRDAGFVVDSPESKLTQLVTDEILVRFPASESDAKILARFQSFGIQVGRRFKHGTFRARVTQSSPFDALDAARVLKEQEGAKFAEPNLHFVAERFETIPADPLFGAQWHLRNTGASGGTVDADADTTLAWDYTQGSSNTVIAVVDNTFDIDHEDLAPNLYTNAGEIPGNGLDDDGNGYVDDGNGWDFISADNDPRPVGGGDNHGTAVTGVAVARSNNGIGVSGACPQCRFLPLTVFNNCSVGGFGCSSNNAAFAEAFDYASFSAAQIITNSWGLSNPAGTASAAVVASIHDATAAGKVVLFAGGNSPSSDYCLAGYPALADVIAVSSSSNRDRKVNGHARGNCIDVLAPTRWGGSDSPGPTGTLAITTTDRSNGAGYNNTDGACIGGLSEPGNLNYTNCFSGTSSATPLTAGVAGLLLSARPALNRVEVQRLLQDTTDRIEDSLGSYATASGYSEPGPTGTHAFGRINAGEAVRIAADAPLGRGGVDVMLRDNRLDWGNTEQLSNVTFEPTRGYLGHWKSVDIKIDAPPYQAAPTDNAGFEALSDESPAEGEVNKVYVRVRNRGPVTASSVTVKLHWTQFGTALANLPADFWSLFPADSADTTQWHPLGVSTLTSLAYSGPSVANCPGRAAPDCDGAVDGAQIAAYDWVGPGVPSGTPNHFCLFAVIDSPQDHVSSTSTASFVPDFITPRDNNVTHRNVEVATAGGSSETRQFFIRNPFPRDARSRLRVSAPKGWQIATDGPALGSYFSIKAGASTVVTAKLLPPGPSAVGEIEFIQDLVLDNLNISGGAVFEFVAKK
jgi:subtilisin family serine protease